LQVKEEVMSGSHRHRRLRARFVMTHHGRRQPRRL
jgi:hypothetical protein